MPSSHLILCCPLLLLPPIPPSIRVFSIESTLRMVFPGGSDGKESACSAGDPGLIPGSGRSPGNLLQKEMITNPLQYSCLENHMCRGAWLSMGSQRVRHKWATNTYTCFHIYILTYRCIIYICNIYLHIRFSFFMIIMFYKVTTDSQQVQKYCGNSVSVVPDHCNKSDTTVMQVIWLFWYPSTYKSYIYSMNCALELSLRKQYTYFN